MAQIVGLGVLLATIALIAAIFVVETKRSRRSIFVAVCAIGAAVGLYGFWQTAVDAQLAETSFLRAMFEAMQTKPEDRRLPTLSMPSYFTSLGLPLSLVVVCALCFAILEIERTFTKKQRTSWLYPALAWYFVAWIVIELGPARK